ncbi:hypothetical protein PspLS_04621 [Pyricularia sp. CBS 133598]|nr:hypothetical protein PspLS_04621 [Pyricularia sp. CBS 133598]
MVRPETGNCHPHLLPGQNGIKRSSLRVPVDDRGDEIGAPGVAAIDAVRRFELDLFGTETAHELRVQEDSVALQRNELLAPAKREQRLVSGRSLEKHAKTAPSVFVRERAAGDVSEFEVVTAAGAVSLWAADHHLATRCPRRRFRMRKFQIFATLLLLVIGDIQEFELVDQLIVKILGGLQVGLDLLRCAKAVFDGIAILVTVSAML